MPERAPSPKLFERSDHSVVAEFEDFATVERKSRENKKYKAFMLDYSIEIKEEVHPDDLKAAVAAIVEVAKRRTNFRDDRGMINITASNPELLYPILRRLKKISNPQNILNIIENTLTSNQEFK